MPMERFPRCALLYEKGNGRRIVLSGYWTSELWELSSAGAVTLPN